MNYSQNIIDKIHYYVKVFKMKIVILAGGFGTRISEESHLIPKPMIEIAGKPILWHIMKYYYSYGFDDFIILAGYKQEVIKNFFNAYYLYNSDITFDFSANSGKFMVHNTSSEKWKVTIVDTGLNTMTGGRIKRIERLIDNKTFFLTYGDGLSDVNLHDLLKFHNINKNNIVTLTATKQSNKYGTLKIDDLGFVNSFKEKDLEDGHWINGGFMVVNPLVFPLILNDNSNFEKDVLPTLAKSNNLAAYKHHGFWQSMDTLRDKLTLEQFWKEGNTPWKIWK
jgi:glucose-1-phosphate cytidylyltransferase